MAIDTWFNVQKWVDHDWVDRSPDGSDWYSTFDNAKYFCDSYNNNGEVCRVIREEVIYDPNRKKAARY